MLNIANTASGSFVESLSYDYIKQFYNSIPGPNIGLYLRNKDVLATKSICATILITIKKMIQRNFNVIWNSSMGKKIRKSISLI